MWVFLGSMASPLPSSVLGLDRHKDVGLSGIDGVSAAVQEGTVFQTSAAFDNFRQAGIQKLIIIFQAEIAVDLGCEIVGMVLRDHDMDIVRIHPHAYRVTGPCAVNGTGHHFVLAGFNGDLIMHALENDGTDDAPGRPRAG